MYAAAVCCDGIPDGAHPSHRAEIFEAVNRADPQSSRATTYNNLRDLVEAGTGARSGGGGARGALRRKGMRHHHFICDHCGNVEDMDWYEVPRPRTRSLGKRVLRQSELIFRGLCGKCASRKTPRLVA